VDQVRPKAQAQAQVDRISGFRGRDGDLD
jgi:hypothetical protein